MISRNVPEVVKAPRPSPEERHARSVVALAWAEPSRAPSALLHSCCTQHLTQRSGGFYIAVFLKWAMPYRTSDFSCEGAVLLESRVGVKDGVKWGRASITLILRLRVYPAKVRIPERRRRDSNPRYPVKRYCGSLVCRCSWLSNSSFT